MHGIYIVYILGFILKLGFICRKLVFLNIPVKEECIKFGSIRFVLNLITHCFLKSLVENFSIKNDMINNERNLNKKYGETNIKNKKEMS